MLYFLIWQVYKGIILFFIFSCTTLFLKILPNIFIRREENEFTFIKVNLINILKFSLFFELYFQSNVTI